MRTMHPVLMVGYHGPDEALLPDDEYHMRLTGLRQLMSEHGLQALVIHGDCDDAALLTYLTNFYPRARWGVGTLEPEGNPVLYVAGGTRDLPFAAAQTWLDRVEPWGIVDRALPVWLDGLRRNSGQSMPRIGCVGFDAMLPPVHRTVSAALRGRAQLVPADALIAAHLESKRPREVAMIHRSARLLGAAVDMVRDRLAQGAPFSDALLAGELSARRAGAHDVRILAGVDGGRGLEPFVRARADLRAPAAAYMAIRHTGYWAAGFFMAGQGAVMQSAAAVAVNAAMDAMLARLRPGISGSDLAALADPHLGSLAPHPVLGDLRAHGIGLRLEEAPILRAGAAPTLNADGVHAVHAGCDDPRAGSALVSALVHFGPDGRCRVLWRG